MRIRLGIHCQSQLGENTKHSAFSFQESGLHCQGIRDIVFHSRCASFIANILNEVESIYIYLVIPVQGLHRIIRKSIICSQDRIDIVKLCSFGKIKAPADTVYFILTFTVSQFFHYISEFRISPSVIRKSNSRLIKHVFINHQIGIVIKFGRKTPDFAVIKHIICLGVLT